MAKDDFVRVIYLKEVEGRKKRSSVSIDPDLYQVFCIIKGSAPAARAIIRQWSIEVDSDRQAAIFQNIGVSRLVHRRMMAEIKDLVEKGLVVVRQEAKEEGRPPQRKGSRQQKQAASPA